LYTNSIVSVIKHSLVQMTSHSIGKQTKHKRLGNHIFNCYDFSTVNCCSSNRAGSTHALRCKNVFSSPVQYTEYW